MYFDKDLKSSASLSIFESLVKPVAFYGSEIWTPYKLCNKNKTLDEMCAISF